MLWMRDALHMLSSALICRIVINLLVSDAA